MRGHGVLQELERRHRADNPRIFEPVVKEWWQPSRVDELPFVLHRAWNADDDRAGPDRSCSTCRWTSRPRPRKSRIPDPEAREARGRPRPDATERRARRGAAARRAAAGDRGRRRRHLRRGNGELRALAERLGAPVVTTWNGKGAIDETHALAGQTIGDTGSTIGNALSANADVILQRRLPLRGLVGVLVAGRGDVRHPADAADPARHRPA